jgi:hypothetical protein
MNTEHCHSFFTVSDPPYKNSLESIWYSTAKPPRTHVPNPKKDAKKGEPPKQEGPAKAEAASQESPYDAMRKRLREKTRNGGNSTPTVKSNSKLAMKDLRADKVWTIGTEDGGIILLVTKNTDFNSPGFTKPFYNKLRTNPYLRDSAKVDLLADRRSNDDPQMVWLCTKQNRSQGGGEYVLHWNLYLHFVASEVNDVQFHKTWGGAMTELLNRAGKKFPWPASFEYKGDIGMTTLGEYLTIGDVFDHIENVYFKAPGSKMSRLDIANDPDIIPLYFGQNEERNREYKEWYLCCIGINPDQPNCDLNAHPRGQDNDKDLVEFARGAFRQPTFLDRYFKVVRVYGRRNRQPR